MDGAQKKGVGMRRLVFNLVLGSFGLALASAPHFGAAHEAHKTECNETAINAMKADIQTMSDGEAKTKAKMETKMAEEMIAKRDVEACKAHMHNAMEAMEE
jgi:hypothetical protein